MKNLAIILFLTILSNCKGPNKIPMKTSKKNTNALINETSPYLLQHAHNPVNWRAWSEEALLEAKKTNKLIIISVGYSACHWCHVMEEESFEDQEVAKIMNDNFICIKVDREERPDIDQVYMNAIQLITGRGGWPLNAVALPDGRPVWGGTYFSKKDWKNALQQLNKQYKNNPEKFIAYANNIVQGINSAENIQVNLNDSEFKTSKLQPIITQWEKSFDTRFGGLKSPPKFMMPNNYLFLLKYAHLQKDKKLLTFVNTTLTKMAYGGIFDPIGGGFSRYSTDIKWHIPHFEKMLYDNGQLVSLYAQAYKLTKNELYKNTLIKTLQFVEDELYHANGYFYSSLDADSVNKKGIKEEGAFYVWTITELKELLKEDYSLFADYYNINDFGWWEHHNYVLIRKKTDETIAEKHKISVKTLQETLQKNVKTLQIVRNKRKKPALDDKTLTSWNALMLIGYLDAYEALQNKHYLTIALKNANFIIKNQLKPDGGLYHNFKNGKSNINGYLEDYATVIEAFIKLYENTLDSKWLFKARDLTNYCFDNFYNDQNSMFYFTSNKNAKLIMRSIEYRDNVIAASNSIMAKNLFQLGIHFNNKNYTKTAKKMLHNVLPEINNYGSAFSNWLILYLNISEPYKEIVVTGNDALQIINTLHKNYLPNVLFSGINTQKENNNITKNLPLLKGRAIPYKTYMYLCTNNVCQLPTENIEDVLKEICL